MAEKEARALGVVAGNVKIGKQEYKIRPLGIGELAQVESDCLDHYKRRYLETFRNNLDLLPEEERVGLLARKIDEVGRWDVGDLPSKYSHDPKAITLSDALRKWVLQQYQLADDTPELRLQRLVAGSLDQGVLTESRYKKLAGKPAPKVRVDYGNWWITGAYDGMITFVWTCFRRDGVTRQQIIDHLGRDIVTLSDVAREIERISAPQSGNG